MPSNRRGGGGSRRPNNTNRGSGGGSRRPNNTNRGRQSGPGWQTLVDRQASTINAETGMGHSIGQAWYDSMSGQLGGVSADEVARYAASMGYNLGNAWADYGRTEWQAIVDRQAQQGTVGQAWYDQTGSSLNVSADEVRDYAIESGASLGQAWGGQAPAFDWEAWNNEMQSRQAATWESYDAMNSEFIKQQQSWMEQQSAGRTNRSSMSVGNSGSADPAAVRRKKAKNTKSGVNTNTGLSAGTPSGAGGSGVSLGGGSGGSNGLSIGKR